MAIILLKKWIRVVKKSYVCINRQTIQNSKGRDLLL